MFNFFKKRALRKLWNFADRDIINPPARYGHCFVFGSNLAGQHGAGAARFAAEKFAAQPGVGVGPTGGAYAIPTMDFDLKPLALEHIKGFVDEFIEEAARNPHVTYHLTPIGTGIAGYSVEDIAPLFLTIKSKNVILPKQFFNFYFNHYKNWL